MKIQENHEFPFNSREEQASFCYQCILMMLGKFNNKLLLSFTNYGLGNLDEIKNNVFNDFIIPIFLYLYENINTTSNVLFLLEKYKIRTEWFNKIGLFEAYKKLDKNYEDILEHDLRLFLFDNGIDYPFSTPKSTSGRADIAGNLGS